MTKYEKMIISAYTGVLMVDMAEFHKWVEKYLKRPVWTHEFASKDFWDKLHSKVYKEFVSICNE